VISLRNGGENSSKRPDTRPERFIVNLQLISLLLTEFSAHTRPFPFPFTFAHFKKLLEFLEINNNMRGGSKYLHRPVILSNKTRAEFVIKDRFIFLCIRLNLVLKQKRKPAKATNVFC